MTQLIADLSKLLRDYSILADQDPVFCKTDYSHSNLGRIATAWWRKDEDGDISFLWFSQENLTERQIDLIKAHARLVTASFYP